MKGKQVPRDLCDREFVPEIPKSLISSVGDDDYLVRNLNHHIDEFNKWVSHVPLEYQWHYKSVKAFKDQLVKLMAAGASIQEINQQIWRDALESCQAFTVMSVWKLVELSRTAANSLMSNDFVVAAVLARAALESAVQYCDAARTITTAIEKISSSELSGGIVASESLERIILKTVFASRLPESDDVYSATNIVTIIKRLSKIADQDEIVKQYSYLCEVAHPNWMGRSVYVVPSEIGGGEAILKVRPPEGPCNSEVVASTLGALSWSFATQMTSSNLMQGSLVSLSQKLQDAIAKSRHQ